MRLLIRVFTMLFYALGAILADFSCTLLPEDIL